jgi:ribosome-associated translation inhibitor RaiA
MPPSVPWLFVGRCPGRVALPGDRPDALREEAVKVEIEGAPRNAALRARIAQGLRKAVRRTAAEPKTALVSFVDVNGPKGGVGIRCSITVWIPRRRPVHVEEMATEARFAFAAAVDVLERGLRRQDERAQERRRRPKKYYVAKRLLEPEADLTTLITPPSGKRRRRSTA